jgi:hypothetical protein
MTSTDAGMKVIEAVDSLRMHHRQFVEVSSGWTPAWFEQEARKPETFVKAAFGKTLNRRRDANRLKLPAVSKCTFPDSLPPPI